MPESPTRILIVEDEGIVAADLQQTLNEMGHDAFAVASSAEEALAIASATRPDLVLMDVRIQGKRDGIETAALLKTMFGPMVIFLTAHSGESVIDRIKRTEPDGYLLKPVNPAALHSMIEIALYKRRLHDAREKTASLEQQKHALQDSNLRKAEALQSANERLTVLTQLNLQLASETDLQGLLQNVCDGARKLRGAEYAVIAVTARHEGAALLYATSGLGAAGEACAPPHPERDTGPLGAVFANRRPWRSGVADGHLQRAPLPIPFPPAHAYLAVPIASITQVFGWLCLADKTGAPEFSVEDERLLGILGSQAGRIYESASLHVELQMHAAQLQVEMAERELANQALRDSEARFRQLADNIQDVFFIFAAHTGESIYLSPAFERVWGRRPNPADPLDWVRSIHASDRQLVLDHVKHSAALATNDDLEYRIVLPDGAIRWILARHFAVRDSGGQPYRVVGVATDVTERKHADDKIQHLNRVYAVLSGINSLIVRAGSQEELFTEACRIAAKHGDFPLAWIGLVDTARRTIAPVACAGESSQVADHMNARGALSFDGDPFIGGAVRSRLPQICNDLVSSGVDIVFGPDMKLRGRRSLVILPLVNQGAVVACLVLATNERESFDEPEMRLLTELADDVSFALDHIDKASKLSYLAYYDSLTGFANRTLFLERLAQNVSVAARGAAQFLVVVADLQRFDTINDTYGRNKGDALLKDIADRFVQCIGDIKAVGRVGPDLFSAIIQFTGEAEVIIGAFEQRYEAWLGAPFEIDGTELRMSARAGIALYPHDGADAEVLLTRAEAALKRAKADGDKFVFFTKEMSDIVAERLALESQLRRAIGNREFVLHYQPKVDLETRAVEGVEALIRWAHPTLGLVPPAKFIGILEESGMIVEAGWWALRQATQDRESWLRMGLNAPRVAVNVSSVQVRKPDFVDVVIDAIAPHTNPTRPGSLAAVGIDIEVTESLLLERADANIEKLRKLRNLGVGIAIDDFGTGYSSLSYLTKLPVATLKIDRSFVSLMLDDPSVMTLVSTMIALAHSLKLKVIAEGVELEEQAKILRLLRCDQMQGFLVSRPLSFDAITHYLERLQSPVAPRENAL